MLKLLALKSRQKRRSKLSSFYFLSEAMRHRGERVSALLTESSDLPVRVRRDTWEHLENPRRLAKIYRFDDAGQLRYFVSEIMQYVDAVNHDIKIIIEGKEVQIETYTHTLEDVTELDIRVARECDQIFSDAQFILEPA